MRVFSLSPINGVLIGLAFFFSLHAAMAVVLSF